MIGKGPAYTIGAMMWDEEHCNHRMQDGKCNLDGDDCPWQNPVKTLQELHDWYPCLRAQGRVNYPGVSSEAIE